MNMSVENGVVRLVDYTGTLEHVDLNFETNWDPLQPPGILLPPTPPVVYSPIPQMVPPPQLVVPPPIRMTSLEPVQPIPRVEMLEEPGEEHMEIVENDTDDEEFEKEFGEESARIPDKFKLFYRKVVEKNENLKKAKAELEKNILEYKRKPVSHDF